jgi:hypothetical protein
MDRLRQRVVERYRRLPPLQELRIEPEPPTPIVRRPRTRLAVKTRNSARRAKPPALPPASATPAPVPRKKRPKRRMSHNFLFRRRR